MWKTLQRIKPGTFWSWCQFSATDLCTSSSVNLNQLLKLDCIWILQASANISMLLWISSKFRLIDSSSRLATHHFDDLEKLLDTLAEIDQKLLKIVKMYLIQNLSTFIYLVTFYLKNKNVNKTKSSRWWVASRDEESIRQIFDAM